MRSELGLRPDRVESLQVSIKSGVVQLQTGVTLTWLAAVGGVRAQGVASTRRHLLFPP
jgi:hypothetical protein